MLRTKQIFLAKDSDALQTLRRADPRLAPVIDAIGPVAYDVYLDDYPFLIWQIVGQMISGQAAAKIGARLETFCEGELTPDAIDALADEDLRRVGLSRPKISYIRGINDALRTGELNLRELRLLDDEEAMKKLRAVRGIGAWTATMLLIFVHDRQNIINAYDRCFMEVFQWLYGVEKVTPAVVKKQAEKWAPYASIAARYFYYALERGLTKLPPPKPDLDEQFDQ